jgi:hypothetical protein
MRYLLMSGNRVANVVVWDGETDWVAPNGVNVLVAPDGVGPGWTYDDGQFTPPPAPEIDEDADDAGDT